MDNLEFEKLDEIIVKSTLFGIHHISDIKNKEHEKIGSIQVPSAQKYWQTILILDNQGNTITKIEGEEKNQPHQVIARIYDSQNTLLATMVTFRSEGNVFTGKVTSIVADGKNKEIFRIAAGFTSGRYGKALNNTEFTRDGRKIVEYESSFWNSETHIKLLEEIDMRIVLASFIQFQGDAGRAAALIETV